MKKKIVLTALAAVLAAGAAFGQDAQELTAQAEAGETISGLSFVRQSVEYTIRDSVDKRGNLYIKSHAQLPSVMTFVNNDGSVTVCSSDETNKVTHVYEYTDSLTLKKTLAFDNETGQPGAFTKDKDGNYYFFYGEKAASKTDENMVMVKYDGEGKKQRVFKLKAFPPHSFSGVNVPFHAGTCRLELSANMLAVYFGRKMFDGHQASYGFVLDKDTFERIDIGAVTNPGNGARLQMPYVSHSFNQFILPVEGGFVFADHGDAYPRSFGFSKFQSGGNLIRVKAFGFPGSIGQNSTYAEMGGLAKTSGGYIFAGAYGKERNLARNVFTLQFDENLSKCGNPVYVTSYTAADGHAGHPKIAALDAGRYLLLWEKFQFSTQSAIAVEWAPSGWQSTYMVTVDENGKALSEVRELKGVRLNMNDVLRYNPRNGKVYWAINDDSKSITVYALEI